MFLHFLYMQSQLSDGMGLAVKPVLQMPFGKFYGYKKCRSIKNAFI